MGGGASPLGVVVALVTRTGRKCQKEEVRRLQEVREFALVESVRF